MFAAGRHAEVSAALKHALCQDPIWLSFSLVPALLKMRRKGLGGAAGGSWELHLGRKPGHGVTNSPRSLPEWETSTQHSSASSSTEAFPAFALVLRCC